MKTDISEKIPLKREKSKKVYVKKLTWDEDTLKLNGEKKSNNRYVKDIGFQLFFKPKTIKIFIT